jgi:hypothetical protein
LLLLRLPISAAVRAEPGFGKYTVVAKPQPATDALNALGPVLAEGTAAWPIAGVTPMDKRRPAERATARADRFIGIAPGDLSL